jgi:hypothetical protein
VRVGVFEPQWEAVNLDMADWWTPTAESYLSRVKKDQILEAIGEGTTETRLFNWHDKRLTAKLKSLEAEKGGKNNAFRNNRG